MVTLCLGKLEAGPQVLTAHQHGGTREEEAVSLLHGEELEHEDHEGDHREDDGKDHEGLHCLERICGHRGREQGVRLASPNRLDGCQAHTIGQL